MSIALLKLLRLNFRAKFRHSLRARTARGLVFVVLGFGVLCLWLGPALYGALKTPRTDPQLVRDVAPFAILGFCLSNLFASFGDGAIAFTGAEVDFLFPGPFSRRELLGYKILKTALGTLFTTLFFSILILRYSRSWFACFVGVWMTVQFMQLFAMAVMMIGQTIGERAYSGGRRAILIVAALIILIGIAPALSRNIHTKPMELMAQFHGTIVGRVLLAPFDVFARTITAGSGDLLKFGAIALAIDLLMLALVIGLDANYLETAATISQKRYERRQRIRAGGLTRLHAGTGPRIHVRQLPWLGGAGPIAWRQLVGAARSFRAMFTLLLIIGGVAVGFIKVQRDTSSSSLQSLIGTVAWMTIVFISMLKFDFRDELDRLDLLRSLPIRPMAVAAAEIFTPVLVLTVMQGILLVVMIYSYPNPWQYVLPAAAFAVPFNVLCVAIENLLFLMFPLRTAGLIAGDMQLFGRQMVVFLFKFLLLFAALAACAAVGAIGFIAGNKSWPAFGVVGWFALVFVAVGSVLMVGRVYSKFDPSVHTPP